MWHPAAAPDIEDAATLASRARAVHDALAASGLMRAAPAAAAATDAPRRTVLEALFSTILSQATTKANSTRAFDGLMRQFGGGECGWAAAAYAAGPAEIEEVIRCAGLGERKAGRMHEILRTVLEERGEFSLEYLREVGDEAAIAELMRFNGVGPKTASCVLMFEMQRHEMPVDTHVNRISGRLGWTKEGQTPVATYDLLNACVPAEIKYALHCQLVDHGRHTCKALKPHCDQCPISTLCASADGERDVDAKRLKVAASSSDRL
jgi:endonuclease III